MMSDLDAREDPEDRGGTELNSEGDSNDGKETVGSRVAGFDHEAGSITGTGMSL